MQKKYRPSAKLKSTQLRAGQAEARTALVEKHALQPPPSPEAVRAGTAPAQSGVKGARAEAKHTLEKAAELRGRLAALQPQGQVSAAFKAKTK